MTDDMHKGIIDRFRSLPMARSAVLTGRTFSDVVYNAGILVVLMLSGLVVGWRVHTDFQDFLLAVALLLLLRVRDVVDRRLARPARADRRGRPSRSAFIGHVPAHVRVERLRPDRDAARLAPAVRGVEPGQHAHGCHARALRATRTPSRPALPGEHPILMTVVWIVVLLAIFVPLAVRKYRSIDR